jgi:hypothetical protein
MKNKIRFVKDKEEGQQFLRELCWRNPLVSFSIFSGFGKDVPEKIMKENS